VGNLPFAESKACARGHLYQAADACLAEQAPGVFSMHAENLTLIKGDLQEYIMYPRHLSWI